MTFVNEFIDTSKTLDEVTAETAGSLLKESKELQNLANEYDTLNSKIDKNTSDRIRMATIVDDLETRLGDSVVAINKETGALNLNRDALDAVIERTALLANDEAIKLVHSIRNTEKAINKQTSAVNKNENSLRNQNLQLQELQKTEGDRFLDQQTHISGNNDLLDSEGNRLNQQREGNVVNKATAEQQIVVNELKDKDKKLTSELNTLEEKRSEQIGLLLEQGFTMAQVESLLTEKREKSTEITNKSTTAITENTNAKIKNTAQDLVNRRNLQIEVGLQQQLLDGKITQQEFDDEFTRLKIKNIQSVLDNEVLTHPERMQLIRERNALQLKGINDEVIARQEQIDGVAQLGTQLINLAGEDKKMQGIKKAGIALSSAAAIANNIQALSEMSLGVASQSKLLFPANIIGMVTTLSTILSLFANIKAMKGAFGDGGIVETFANGGMVNGKSHAQGGEKFAVGGRVVELEGGEAVINKRSTAMFSSQLSAMNAAGGGVKFADGGLLNQPSFSQQQFNALGQNQMMGAMGGSSKVVVVEADITDSQNAVSVIQSQATI